VVSLKRSVRATVLSSRTPLEIYSAANGMSLLNRNTPYGDVDHHTRYINTDYIVASYLQRCRVRDLKISYDIACKWSINFYDRFETQHEDLDLSRFCITYFVPKFHLPAHGAKCQTQYSFNYARGVGRTHGETVEQEWAYINLAALSTREMGPGARHSALDDSWGGWNWKKVLGLGKRTRHLLLFCHVLINSDRFPP